MGNIYYFSKLLEGDSERAIRLRKIILLSSLLIVAVNLPLISAYIVISGFGNGFTLYPGEDYIINIPFTSNSNSLTKVCGKTSLTNGTPLRDVNVTLLYADNGHEFGMEKTNTDGEFCFNVYTSDNETFDVNVSYDNSTMTLGNNDYDFNFDDYQLYNKSTDSFIVLTGNITNYDAIVEDGRFEIKLRYKGNGTWTTTGRDVSPYYKYYLNIGRNEVYNIPNNELNFSWSTNGLDIGEYKFLIKSSFNGEQKTSVDFFFNITS